MHLFGSIGYISALKFIHALEIDQAFLVHTSSGAGSPPPQKKKKNNREILKFGLKFSVLESITSGLVEVSSRNFSVDVPRGRGDKVGTIFGRPAPKKLGRQKIVQNWRDF